MSGDVKVSVVVVAYDIERELPRTLRSLSADYQVGIDAADFEVIVVDNGSPNPVDESVYSGLAGNFRLLRIEDASPSPAHAVNVGLDAARGAVIGVLVDGARLVSPGLLHTALAASRAYDRAGVVTLGWYLGFDYQRRAAEAGWTKVDEDRLLESIAWPDDGYRLFEIATLDESSTDAWLSVMFESNALFLQADVWKELAGYDEHFDLPGGGVVNHDTLRRASELGLRWVVLLGEATFHQLHGGVATNAAPEDFDREMDVWIAQYDAIRGGRPNPLHLPDPVFFGALPVSMRPHFAHLLNRNLHAQGLLEAPVPPPAFLPDVGQVADPMAAAWFRLAATAARCGEHVEAMHYARLGRAAGGDRTNGGPLLAVVASMGTIEDDIPEARQVQFHLDAAAVYEQFEYWSDAERHYRAVLAIQPGHNDAYLGWARARMPGPFYLDVLERVHKQFAPPTYLEIGVCEGASIRLAGPETRAIGVDPVPQVGPEIRSFVELYEETSGEFFETRDVRELFGGAPSMVFIDGLHEFPTALADFASVEEISGPETVVVLHDMLPLDEPTQRAERVHNFYTGDVWKMLHCLSDARPSLRWFTVRTPPSGLTFVTGLDPTATSLRERYDELVAQYDALPFDPERDTPGDVIDNDWDLIAERLSAWRTPIPGSSAPVSAAPAGPSRASVLDRELERRIESLERIDDSGRATITDLKRQLTDVSLELEDAKAALAAMRGTRLYRWTRPLRRVWGRVRHGHTVA